MQEPRSVGSRDTSSQAALGLLGKHGETNHSETKSWPAEEANGSQDKAGA